MRWAERTLIVFQAGFQQNAICWEMRDGVQPHFFKNPEESDKTGREPVREPPWGESDLIRPGGGRIAAGVLCALFTVGFLLHNVLHVI